MTEKRFTPVGYEGRGLGRLGGKEKRDSYKKSREAVGRDVFTETRRLVDVDGTIRGPAFMHLEETSPKNTSDNPRTREEEWVSVEDIAGDFEDEQDVSNTELSSTADVIRDAFRSGHLNPDQILEDEKKCDEIAGKMRVDPRILESIAGGYVYERDRKASQSEQSLKYDTDTGVIHKKDEQPDKTGEEVKLVNVTSQHGGSFNFRGSRSLVREKGGGGDTKFDHGSSKRDPHRTYKGPQYRRHERRIKQNIIAGNEILTDQSTEDMRVRQSVSNRTESLELKAAIEREAEQDYVAQQRLDKTLDDVKQRFSSGEHVSFENNSGVYGDNILASELDRTIPDDVGLTDEFKMRQKKKERRGWWARMVGRVKGGSAAIYRREQREKLEGPRPESFKAEQRRLRNEERDVAGSKKYRQERKMREDSKARYK